MKSVEQMITDIILREGDYVNHPDDKGGPTKFGITLDTLEEWRGEGLTEDDVKRLTEDEARDIFRVNFYEVPSIFVLPEILQPIMFDAAVSHGPSTAVKLLQNLINEFNSALNLRVDGIIGAKTGKAAAWFVENAALILLVERRSDLYCDIVTLTPLQEVFLDGWVKWANELKGGEIA